MNSYLVVLKKVGFVLLAFGLADIAFMVYCLTHGQSYSSSFNIFAVLAGVFLIRGNLSAVRIITWFSAFMLTGFIGAIFFVFPFTQPMRLFFVQFKLNPLTSISLWLFALLVLVLLGWVYFQMRSESVLAALKSNGRNTAIPKMAIGFGIVLVAFLSVMLNKTLNGDLGAKATELASKQLGPSYNYSTQSIQWSGSHGRASVVAYNENEIRYVPVEW